MAVCCASEALSRSGKFVDYVDRLTLHVLERAPHDLEDLAAQDWSYRGGTVSDAQRRFVEEVGEDVRVKGLARFAHPEGRIWTWVHPDCRRGVMLNLLTPAPMEELREVAFQLAGQILTDRAGDLVVGEDGPQQVCDVASLLLRPWARDPERSVGEVLEAKLGEGTNLHEYAHFDLS